MQLSDLSNKIRLNSILSDGFLVMLPMQFHVKITPGRCRARGDGLFTAAALKAFYQSAPEIAYFQDREYHPDEVFVPL